MNFGSESIDKTLAIKNSKGPRGEEVELGQTQNPKPTEYKKSCDRYPMDSKP